MVDDPVGIRPEYEVGGDRVVLDVCWNMLGSRVVPCRSGSGGRCGRSAPSRSGDKRCGVLTDDFSVDCRCRGRGCGCEVAWGSLPPLALLSAEARLVYALPISDGKLASPRIHLNASEPIRSVSRSFAIDVLSLSTSLSTFIRPKNLLKPFFRS